MKYSTIRTHDLDDPVYCANHETTEDLLDGNNLTTYGINPNPPPPPPKKKNPNHLEAAAALNRSA